MLRRLNRTAIIRLAWERPGLSRSEIAAQLGLTKSAISLLAQELIQQGWLLEPDADPSAARVPGRPSIPLSIHNDRFALIGLEVGVDFLNAVCIDPTGTLLWTRHVDGNSRHLRDTLERAATLIDDLRLEAQRHGRTVIGVGVGVPGPVDIEHGLLLQAPNLDWENIPLHRLLSEHLPDLPAHQIHVDNDANLAALCEYLFGKYRQTSDLMFILIEHGVGGGLIQNHRMYRGRHGFAGEIGHTIVQPNGPKCACGNFGCAETLFSVTAFEREMQRETGIDMCFPDFLERVRRKDAAALRVMQRAAAHFRVFINNITNTLDPEIIFVGGAIAELGEALLEPALQSVQRRAFGTRHRNINIVQSQYGADACAIGAAGFAWHKMLETAALD